MYFHFQVIRVVLKFGAK